jgi:SAM-dependent methyltransferase
LAEWFEAWFDEDYAQLYAHRDEEEARVAMARALRVAPELLEGPVLDLACGIGRHLEILRRANPLAFGIDLSRTLLAMAPSGLRPWLLRGDMRQLPVKEGTLAGICLWFTPFGYFSDGENRALLARLARLLRPGGVLVLDYFNAAHVRATLVGEDESLHRGLKVLSRRSVEGDRLVKRMDLTRLDSGATRRVTESVRLYEPAELKAMAGAASLRAVREAGDYRGGPFDPAASPRWIGFLEKVGVDSE